jgi:hypothetical protein
MRGRRSIDRSARSLVIPPAAGWVARRSIGLEVLRQSRMTVIAGEAISKEVLPAAITA